MKLRLLYGKLNKDMNDQYAELYSSYQWFVPSQFNIAQACVHRWAQNPHEGRRVAIHYEDEFGQHDAWTYTRLSEATNQLANGLTKMGVSPQDRVAVLMEQRPETAVAYMAILSVGAIVVPLYAQWQSQDLAACLTNAQARVAIVDAAYGPDLLQAQMQCQALTQIIGLGFQHDNIIRWNSLLARQPSFFKPPPAKASNPALLLYTEPIAADAQGCLFAHSALIGSLPGFVAAQNWFPLPNDVFWTPSDWVGTDAILNALLPSLYFGRTLVATTGGFSSSRAFEIMQRYQVTNVFLSTTTLKTIMKEVQTPHEHYQLVLRAISTSGDALGSTAFTWSRQQLNITPNETFSQPEMNCFIGNSQQKWPALAGSMGRAYPGHRVDVLDASGKPCKPGSPGRIALNRYDIHGYPDPSLFARYWQHDAATQAKFDGEWCLTNELAKIDDDGYFWHLGNTNDIFKSAGTQIVPETIENCLLGHAAVASSAIFPKHLNTRSTLIKARVVLTPAYYHADTATLITALQKHVKALLGEHQVPAEIEFADTLPMTTGGKLRRSLLRDRDGEA